MRNRGNERYKRRGRERVKDKKSIGETARARSVRGAARGNNRIGIGDRGK